MIEFGTKTPSLKDKVRVPLPQAPPIPDAGMPTITTCPGVTLAGIDTGSGWQLLKKGAGTTQVSTHCCASTFEGRVKLPTAARRTSDRTLAPRTG
jgi:hypothetical protein